MIIETGASTMKRLLRGVKSSLT